MRLRLILLVAFLLSACSTSQVSSDLDATAVSETTESLIVDKYYWINALPVGNGKFGYFAGVRNAPGPNEVISDDFTAGTKVFLTDVRDKDCKVEGQSFLDNNVIQGWIDCARLIDYEPTPVPGDLYIHAP